MDYEIHVAHNTKVVGQTRVTSEQNNESLTGSLVHGKLHLLEENHISYLDTISFSSKQGHKNEIFNLFVNGMSGNLLANDSYRLLTHL